MDTMTINAAMTEAFTHKVEKLNRRAAKLGLAPVVFRFGETAERECSKETFCAYRRDKRWFALYTEVFLLGEAPVVHGHRFVATVDLMGTNPMVRRQPWASKADLSRFFHTDGHCDHCNTLRARNDVLVFEEVATGKLMQIGRNCAADFLRSSDATAMLRVSDWVEALDFEESDYHGKYAQPVVSIERLFTVAAGAVRQFGWASLQMVEKDNTLRATRGRVSENLFGWKIEPEDKIHVTPEDAVVAAEIIAWMEEKFLNKDAAACREFDLSVRAAVETAESGARFVRGKNINYLTWMVNGYTVDMEKQRAARAAQATRDAMAKSSDYVGAVGDKIEVEATLVFRRVFSNTYGVQAMCKFNVGGNVFTWWSGTELAMSEMKIEQTYTLKGTIKSHEEYEGVKQTVLTRVKVV